MVVAASGDHVAVTQPWAEVARPVYVSADAGENWNPSCSIRRGERGKLFVLSDDRLMLVGTWDFGPAAARLKHTLGLVTTRGRCPADGWDLLDGRCLPTRTRRQRQSPRSAGCRFAVGVQHRSHRLVDHPRTRLLRWQPMLRLAEGSCTRPEPRPPIRTSSRTR